jgi:nucleoid-associated protein YgaU
MNVALVDPRSKHLFEESVDTEQVFVVGCRHGEQRFDARNGPGRPQRRVTPAAYNVPHDAPDDRVDDRKDLPMTALLTASLPEYLDEPVRPGRPELRLVQAPERRGLRHRTTGEDTGWAAEAVQLPRRRASVAVRRRRTILATMGLALVLLALPLGGSGGTSHTTGSASAAQLHGSSYTVRAGDTLWSIAERVDPNGDPRPLVSQMASELGSYNVVPGELVTVP